MMICDFMWLCTEETFVNVEIWGLDSGETLWKGRGDEIPDKYKFLDMCSWDMCEDGHICFNVDK